MKNPAPHIRKAIYAALLGNTTYNDGEGYNTTVPVYENQGTEEQYQILIGEYSDADRSTKNNFGATGRQVIEIVSERQDSVRKHVDAIGDIVMSVLKPTIRDTEVLSDSEFQIMIKGKPDLRHLTEDSGEGSKIVRLLITMNLLTTEI
jgi:hypothetical protein